MDRMDIYSNTGARVINSGGKWHQQYEKLVEWKRKNGNCIVLRGNKEDQNNKVLAKWVNTQLEKYTNNKLHRDREKLLEELGFVWRLLLLLRARNLKENSSLVE